MSYPENTRICATFVGKIDVDGDLEVPNSGGGSEYISRYKLSVADRVEVIREVTAGQIDLTPSWVAVLPILLAALTEGTEEGQKIAREELARMAKAADVAASQ